MSFYAISALINTITSCSLGVLILLANHKRPLNVTFFLAAASVSVWSFAYFMWQISINQPDALFWIHWFMVGSIFISPTYFHFVTVLTGHSKRLQGWVRGGYAQAILFLAINWSSLFIQSVGPKLSFAFWPTPGPLYHIFLVIAWAYILATVILLFQSIQKTKGEQQGQLRYVLVATVIGFVGGYTNYFLWYNIPIPPFGNIAMSIYIALVAYAIMRHQLFNMKVLATELLIFSLWLFIFIRMLLSNTTADQVANAGLLLVTLAIGTLLIRSVDREVTQRERLEKLTHDLEAANARLKTLDQQKSEFLGIAAHQLRSPIATIKGYTSLILEGSYGRVTKKMYEPVQTMFEVASRMADSIDEFLNISRIEQGRMEYKKERKSIEELVEKMVHMYEAAATEKHLALTLEKINCTHETHLVDVDVAKLDHVLNNLIDNAIKYTPHGSVTVRIVCADAEKKIRVSVSDTGGGIPPEALPELFNKFVRAANARKMDVSGSGLGLYLARQIIEAHGGKIWAESTGEGKGSTFAFELPLATA